MGLEPRRDRYDIVRPIGEGGMGTVFEAFDRDGEKSVALKKVRRASPSALARFKREFRVLANLVHPNLITLHELVADDDNLFFTMELIDGVPFHRWVRVLLEPGDADGDATVVDDSQGPTVAAEQSRKVSADTGEFNGATEVTKEVSLPKLDNRGPAKRSELDVRRLRSAVRQLAEGLSVIHEAGLLHRDLKPGNVIVTPAGRVVILDFGLATYILEEDEAKAEVRALEGTIAFMSPEQASRDPLTPASDWYAVGVMLYLSLTGRVPFLGARELVLMDKQRFEPAPPDEIVEGLPRDLCALCTDLLRTSPERRPTGAEVLRRLGSDAAAIDATGSRSTGSRSSVSTFVGREFELKILERSLAAASEGGAVMVQISGISGVGKSRLVDGFLATLNSDVLVLRGRCYERELVPFKAVDSLIDALARHLMTRSKDSLERLMPRNALALARAFPVLKQMESFAAKSLSPIATTDPQELRRLVFAGLRELFGRLAEEQPLVLALDDLQWGDLDSAALLATLLASPGAPAMLVLGTQRSEDEGTSDFLTEWAGYAANDSIDVRQLPVGALSFEEARQMALAHLADEVDVEVHAEWIARESNGSPLFVEELARHMRLGSGKLGWGSLNDALKDRVRRLPDEAGRLLSMVAVVGRPLSIDVAMRAAELSDPAVLSLLRAGSFVRTRLVAGERLVECYHDRIRETATSLLPENELAHCHERLAFSYEASKQPDPDALATHYFGAGDHIRAGEFAVQAAERAAHTFAFDRAASFLEMALQTDPDNRALLISLGDALSNAGRGAEAAAAFLAAVEVSESDAEKLELRCRASWQLLSSGYVDRGIETLQRVLSVLGIRYPASPQSAIASLVWGRARLRLRGLGFVPRKEPEIPATRLAKVDALLAAALVLAMTESVRSADFHVRSLREALEVGEPARVARALVGEAAFVSLMGVKTSKRTAEILRRAKGVAETVTLPETQGFIAAGEGTSAFHLGNFPDAYDYCAKAERIFREECTGFHWEISTMQLFQGFSCIYMGRIREIAERFPIIVKEANERSCLYSETSFRICLGFYLPLAKDNPNRAMEEVDDAMARWSVRGYQLQHLNAYNARLVTDLYRGDGNAALERGNAEWPKAKESLLLRAQILRVMVWAGRGRAALMAREQGAGPGALKLAQRARRILLNQKVPYSTAQGLGVSAGIAFQRGDLDRAVKELRAGIKLAQEVQTHIVATSMKRALGGVLGGAEGAELVREADEFFFRQGLTNPAGMARTYAPGFGEYS